MDRKIALITFLVFVHLFASWCNAGSIWAKRGPNSKSIYSDDKANQIGDILTIIITEEMAVLFQKERLKAVQCIRLFSESFPRPANK